MNKKLFKPKLISNFINIPLILGLSFGINKTAKSNIIENEIVDVNILMPAPFAESTRELIADFNKEYKNKIRLKVTKGPMQTEAVSDLAISNLLLGSNEYDALLIDITWLPKYAAAGWLDPIDEYINKELWNNLMPGAKLGNKFNKKIYRWPLVADMGLLYWRKDLMSYPPRTPEELENISRQLIKDGKVEYGYVWQGKQYEGLSCVFLELVSGFGGNWINKKGVVELDRQASINAISWLSKLIRKGISPQSVINFTENETLQAFEAGNAAFMRNWPYAWKELQKKNSKVRGNVGVTTMVAKKGHASVATLGSWGFSLMSSSKNKLETYKAIEFLTSPSSQEKLFINFGYSPVSAEIYENKRFIRTYPMINVLKLGLRKTKARPQTPIYAQISGELQRALSNVLTNQEDANKAMIKANNNTLTILKSAGGY